MVVMIALLAPLLALRVVVVVAPLLMLPLAPPLVLLAVASAEKLATPRTPLPIQATRTPIDNQHELPADGSSKIRSQEHQFSGTGLANTAIVLFLLYAREDKHTHTSSPGAPARRRLLNSSLGWTNAPGMSNPVTTLTLPASRVHRS